MPDPLSGREVKEKMYSRSRPTLLPGIIFDYGPHPESHWDGIPQQPQCLSLDGNLEIDI